MASSQVPQALGSRPAAATSIHRLVAEIFHPVLQDVRYAHDLHAGHRARKGSSGSKEGCSFKKIATLHTL